MRANSIQRSASAATTQRNLTPTPSTATVDVFEAQSTRSNADAVASVPVDSVQHSYPGFYTSAQLAQLAQVTKHYVKHAVAMNVPADKFVHNNFVWCDPRVTSNVGMRKNYAQAVSELGTFASFIEADALSNMLGVRLGLWSKQGRDYKRICWLGACDEPAATVHVLEVKQRHFQAFFPPGPGNPQGRTIDGGHGGDCLFLSVRLALQDGDLAAGTCEVGELRLLTAQHILASDKYDERIRAASESALYEHEMTGGFRRFWQRIG